MSQRPGWSCVVALTFLAVLPGCFPDGSCGKTTTTTLTDFEAVPSGFPTSPAELLLGDAGTYVGELRWRPNDGPIMVAHAGTSSPVELTVGDTPVEVRLVAVERDGQYPDGQDGGTLCSSRLQIDADVEFRSDDGLFAERWLSTFEYRKQDAPAGLSMSQRLDFETHEGTLSESDFQFNGASVESISLSAGFANRSVSGSVMMGTSNGAGPVASFDGEAE